ncbi:hypothetical protein Daesc_010075 [Daldinia eschscholtzii]|uniref:Uncharacterized protein n=1 Tax=Daldinia eschscholtzii TaxID=292717 RepID=A0AAX6M6S0_9PEZI
MMAEKSNSNRFRNPATRPNNRRGPQGANFEEDYPMGGVDSSTTKNRHSPRKRRGQNTCHLAHGRTRSPYSGNSKNNSRDQYSRNNHNFHHSTRGHTTNAHTNGNPKMKHNNRRHRGPASIDDESPGLDENTYTSTFDSSLSLRCTNSGVYKSKNSNMRSCTECSSVRRANLRFRNWAARALSQCNQQFAAWADDAGVGFDTYDEMDWQPEPQQQQQRPPIGPIPKPGPWAWPPWSGNIAQDGGLETSQGIACGGDEGCGVSLTMDCGMLGGRGNYSELSGSLLSQKNPVGTLDPWSMRDPGGYEFEDY